jgi:hypothetical protein
MHVDLPIVLQREYNAYLYGALPLCAALGRGNSQWFHRRFFQLFALRDVRGVMVGNDFERPYTHLDFVDATAVLDGPFTVERTEYHRAAGELGSLTHHVRAATRNGQYVIAFVDLAALNNREEVFLHEILVHGFDDAERQVHAITFGYDNRFQTVAYDYESLDRAFDRCLAHIDRLRERSGVRFPVATLSARSTESEEDSQQEAMWAQLEAYRTGRAVNLQKEYCPGYWWLWSPEEHAFYASTPMRFGVDASDVLIDHLQDVLSGQRPIDYRHFHVLAEHKKLVARRLELLLTAIPQQDQRDLTAAWKSTIATADTNRMRVMRNRLAYSDGRWTDDFIERQANLVAMLSDTLRSNKAAELSILDRILAHRTDQSN